MPAKPHIYLTGFMGVGKTKIGKTLAKMLHRPFFDLDAVIEKESGLTVAQIFSQFGEAGFRERETRALRRLAQRDVPAVISLGGGTILKAQNRTLLQNGHWFFLHRPLAQIALRLKNSQQRPLLAASNWSDLYRAREPYYRLAPYTLYCENFSFEVICARVKRALCDL